jgi:uncharacterized iron-regulated membrane protein
MRACLLRLHRWFGLSAALFLFLSGVTGAIIAWDHELDALLNPGFYRAAGTVPPLSPFALADRVEAADPRLSISYLPLRAEPGRTVIMFVRPRTDARTGHPYVLGFDQIAVDPGTGRIQARRAWGELSLRREALLPMIYKLHYTLHLPVAGGIQPGVWLLGIVGIAWTFDSAIALWLSFPRLASWRKSFAFRWRRGGYALLFDAHRSGGVWLWALLLVVAVTSVSMNLGQQVVSPVVSWFSPLSPDPFGRTLQASGVAVLSRTEAVRGARALAAARGVEAPPGAVFHVPAAGIYGVAFFEGDDDHGGPGLGVAWLYVDDRTGKAVGQRIPGVGSAGDIFMQAQFPLHSGRILGLPGRILVSLLGLAVAALSVTGVAIWAKKRAGRRQAAMMRGRTAGMPS